MKKYRESVPLEDQDEAYIHFVKERQKQDAINQSRGEASPTSQLDTETSQINQSSFPNDMTSQSDQ